MQDATGATPAVTLFQPSSAAFACAVSAAGDRVCVVLSDGGKGYDCYPTSAVVVPLVAQDGVEVKDGDGGDEGSKIVHLVDPYRTLTHCRNASHCRGVCWARHDTLLLLLTAASSTFGCPLLSAYNAITGQCVSRFCCPFSHNFDFLAVTTIGDKEVIVLVDDGGKMFFFHFT